MNDGVEITLEGVAGFGATLVFKGASLEVSLGSSGLSRKIAIVSQYEPEVYIVGGEGFRTDVVACRGELGEWNESELGLLVFKTLLDHFRTHPDAYEEMLKNTRRARIRPGPP